LAEETIARIGLLRFLSRVFLREIDTDFIAVLHLPDIIDVLTQADSAVAEWLAADWAPSDYEDAAVEFCRLFVVPGDCVPLASAWLLNPTNGKSKTGDCSIADLSVRLSQSLQLTLEGDLVRLPADHLSVLLEITAWLVENSDLQVAEDFQDAALKPWINGFAARLGSKAEVPGYRAAAVLLSKLL
jgi:TorA maturation chaperone TorD